MSSVPAVGNVELVHADTGVCIDPGAAEGGAARGTSGGDDIDAFSTSLLCHRGEPDLKTCSAFLVLHDESICPQKRLGEYKKFMLSMK